MSVPAFGSEDGEALGPTAAKASIITGMHRTPVKGGRFSGHRVRQAHRVSTPAVDTEKAGDRVDMAHGTAGTSDCNMVLRDTASDASRSSEKAQWTKTQPRRLLENYRFSWRCNHDDQEVADVVEVACERRRN